MRPKVLTAIARHPSLWLTALVQGSRLVPRRWWSRRPFLPVPDGAYLRFRMETQYGGHGDRSPEPDDVVSWLRWCREIDQSRRSQARTHR